MPLQDSIYSIKTAYNKEFDEVFLKKEMEIAKISEKNKRIRKILNDLDLPQGVFEPGIGDIEKPEVLFVTRDDEVRCCLLIIFN